MAQFDFGQFKNALPITEPKYEMFQKEGSPYFRVTLIADVNDGDYLTTTERYSEEVFHRDIIDELVLLQTFFLGQANLEDAYDKIYDVNLPFEGQSGQGCHTLETMKVEYVDKYGTLYDVQISQLEYEEEV